MAFLKRRGLLFLVAGPACVAGLRMGSEKATVVEEHAVYPWATVGGDNLRSGTVQHTAPHVIKKAASWTFKEEAKVGKSAQFPNFTGLVRATPLVDDKANIYMSTASSGVIYKLDSEGKTVWTYQHVPDTKLPGTSTLMDGKLFSADNKGTVFALDMESGSRMWSKEVASSIADDAWSLAAGEGYVISPAINEERLAASGATDRQNNRIVAMDAATGATAWTFDLDGDASIVNALISIKQGSCVFADNDGNIYRVDLKTGQPIWRAKGKNDHAPNIGSAIIDPQQDVVYSTWNEVGWEINKFTLSGKVGAFNFTTGKQLWRYSCQYPTNGPPSVGVFGRGKNAARLLVVPTGMPPSSPDPSMGVFAGQGDAHMSRITLLHVDMSYPGVAGSQRFFIDLKPWHGAAKGDDERPDPCLPKAAISGPTISGDGSIYFGHMNGELMTISDANEDGWIEPTEISSFQTGAAFNAAPVIAPGMLLAAPCDGLHVWKF
eukprot:CAMPEP_0171169052 /NCGR_PEP_ID=MMETSP0790-20130122/8019_1 /TAXON_ID=2925 /ORGANISM="Alexandrium catenella, Strain OF101" /LENGTH=490 /DNA_ID=CAMNT_0011633895 /DNA_START=52 /DNA_END=1524 /DNA_ORIENTATION=-